MGQGFRPEIQGLRAVAVLSVLLFHIWPALMPGGYVGVDVFFVISGYLITGLLLREIERTGRISLLEFYSRRIRRLLPAATAVLVSVAICLQFVSPVKWGETGEQIAASALYYQNWWLALQAVDYLGAEDAPGPLQHFWSLSIEEQYYILWPLTFSAVSGLLLRGRVSGKAVFIAMIAAVFIASLAYSIYLTPRNPGWAYFATTSRAWELALGGALAALPATWRSALRPAQMSMLALLGLGLIVFSVRAYSPATPFPGYAALVPTMGAVLVLFGAGGTRPTVVSKVLSANYMQYVGDLSYSLYLWHWPVVVYAYALLGVQKFSLVEGLIVFVISLALAHLSKQMIEDRWRSALMYGDQQWKVFLLGALCILLSLIATFWVFDKLVKSGPEVLIQRADAAAIADREASVMDFSPRLLDAVRDVGTAFRLGCITTTLGTSVQSCELVDNPRGPTVVVVGDSHAAAWTPAFEALASERGWNLIAVLKSACPFALFPFDVQESAAISTVRSCMEWEKAAVPFVKALEPDLLVTAHSATTLAKVEAGRQGVIANAIVAAWGQFDGSRTKIVALAATPHFVSKVPECLGLNLDRPSKCGRDREAALPKNDPLRLAADQVPGVSVVDLNDRICGPERCEGVVDGILAWRDGHHMTRTFAASLADPLGKEIDAVTEARFQAR